MPVVPASAGIGYFTSMDQALIGAMADAGLARGCDTVQWPVVTRIPKGWLVWPAAGFHKHRRRSGLHSVTKYRTLFWSIQL
ncbi:MAG: hypothetical protein ACRET0_16770, partial [Steroidobacteraceae bacterium]